MSQNKIRLCAFNLFNNIDLKDIQFIIQNQLIYNIIIVSCCLVLMWCCNTLMLGNFESVKMNILIVLFLNIITKYTQLEVKW